MNYTPYRPRRDFVERIKEQLDSKDELLGFYRDERGYHYKLIRFHECGHECYIRAGASLECKDKKCLYEKMSRIRKISHNRPEVKAKMRQINIENNARPEVKEKHKKFFTEYWGKEENRKIASQKKTEYFSHEENRKAQSERRKIYFLDENNRKKSAQYFKEWKKTATPEEKALRKQKIKETMLKPENRQRISTQMRGYFSDPGVKWNYLQTRAAQERQRANRDEVYFINILENKNIQYVWQVPFMTESGKGYIFDFYLPEFNLYVNVDGGIHGTETDNGNYFIEAKKEADRMLDEYCKEYGINLCHISVKNLRSDDFNLKEVINL